MYFILIRRAVDYIKSSDKLININFSKLIFSNIEHCNKENMKHKSYFDNWKIIFYSCRFDYGEIPEGGLYFIKKQYNS